MTPLDQILAFDWSPFIAGAMVLGAVVFAVVGTRTFHRPVTEPRVRPAKAEPIDFGREISGFIGSKGLTRTAIESVRNHSNNEAATLSGPASRTKENKSLANLN